MSFDLITLPLSVCACVEHGNQRVMTFNGVEKGASSSFFLLLSGALSPSFSSVRFDGLGRLWRMTATTYSLSHTHNVPLLWLAWLSGSSPFLVSYSPKVLDKYWPASRQTDHLIKSNYPSQKKEKKGEKVIAFIRYRSAHHRVEIRSMLLLGDHWWWCDNDALPDDVSHRGKERERFFTQWSAIGCLGEAAAATRLTHTKVTGWSGSFRLH